MAKPWIEELRAAYAGTRVLVTGHTGFKGSWLTFWLEMLGAQVAGVALEPDTEPSLFRLLGNGPSYANDFADIRDFAALRDIVARVQPQVIFHLAAQPLVRLSYEEPLETLQTNVIGTANLLEAVRREKLACAVVVVTSDKCYENREWEYAYREDDALGGHDIYSMSKGAAELVVSGYRRSFFPVAELAEHGVRLASARAGNVIGGGDWARHRLIPDAVRALVRGEPIPIRNPNFMRPWQHVLEPLSGYLLLGMRLLGHAGVSPHGFCEAFNLGPALDGAAPVRDVVQLLTEYWGTGSVQYPSVARDPHEARLLRLAVDKAYARLGWRAVWSLRSSVQHTVQWYKSQAAGASSAELKHLCEAQIQAYSAAQTQAIKSSNVSNPTEQPC